MTGPKSKGALLNGPRERLRKLREREISRLRGQGRLVLFDAIDAALAALDGVPAQWEPADHAVVGDDGRTIRLALYAESGAVAAVELDPVRAITLAGELIEAALPKLAH